MKQFSDYWMEYQKLLDEYASNLITLHTSENGPNEELRKPVIDLRLKLSQWAAVLIEKAIEQK